MRQKSDTSLLDEFKVEKSSDSGKQPGGSWWQLEYSRKGEVNKLRWQP